MLYVISMVPNPNQIMGCLYKLINMPARMAHPFAFACIFNSLTPGRYCTDFKTYVTDEYETFLWNCSYVNDT